MFLLSWVYFSRASWDDGHVVWGKAVFDVSENSKFDKTEVLLNGWYQDAEISEDRLGGGLEWATSAAVRITEGPLGIRFNGIVQTKAKRRFITYVDDLRPYLESSNIQSLC